jgi:hypothetical protein
MAEVRAESWLELQELLFGESWDESLGLYRSSYAYRGRADANDRLVTSILRLGGNAHELEATVMRAFRKYAAADAVPHDTPWDWLALGQHHGLPTRLLDWTYSPLVALHFVTAGRDWDKCDGVVFCIDYIRAHELLPNELRRLLDQERANVFTTELLTRAAPTIGELARYSDEPFVLFVEPPSFDERIVNQYALFSSLSRVEASLDEWVERHPVLCRRVIVPAELKWEVRDKLDQANVTERVLFPGLDGLSLWLKRYYEPRNRNR